MSGAQKNIAGRTAHIRGLKQIHRSLAYAAQHKYGDGDVTRDMQESLEILERIIAEMEEK